jgi:hypothetical protein
MSLSFSADRNLLASGGVDGTVHLWGFSSEYPKEQYVHHPQKSEVHALAISGDNQFLASASGSLTGNIALWSISPSGIQPVKVCTGHGPVGALTFFPDNRTLVSGSADSTVRLWDVTGTSAQEKTKLRGHQGLVQALAVAPDGKMLASGGQDAAVRLWTPGSLWWSEHAAMTGHHGAIAALAFSPDGKTVASGGTDAVILLWDVASSPPKLKAVLEGHQSALRRLIFVGDGKQMISVSDRGRVILWDLEAGKFARDWPAPGGSGMMVSSVSLTYDGRYLALGKNDGSIAVLRLYPKSKSE